MVGLTGVLTVTTLTSFLIGVCFVTGVTVLAVVLRVLLLRGAAVDLVAALTGI